MRKVINTTFFSLHRVDGITRITDLNGNFTHMNKDEVKELYEALEDILKDEEDEA